MEHIKFHIEEGIATIMMNRPDRLNAFNRAMALELQHCLDVCATDHEVRVVYFTGAGKGFCAGQDIAELTGPNPPSIAQILSEHCNPIIRKIRTIAKPVVAGVNGVAAGAGANVALCCDIVVARRSASFIQAFSKIGLIPDSGGTFFLPRLIGWQKASALMMTGDKVSAEEAEKMGMIYKIFEDDAFDHDVKQLLEALAAMPTRSFALTKHALNYSFTNDYSAQLELEDKLQQEAALSYDYREGIDAFINKRKPEFKGE
jgi:2-(1,2-epoxy-1,2-dihydrophenyl)acetyl-CoA isomerase